MSEVGEGCVGIAYKSLGLRGKDEENGMDGKMSGVEKGCVGIAYKYLARGERMKRMGWMGRSSVG